jgi:hypothetical protein
MWFRIKKGRLTAGLFFLPCAKLCVDSIHRAGIYTSTAIDTGISINCPLVSRFTDGINRTRVITCTAIDTFFGNSMSQGVHLLLFGLLSSCLI